MGEIPAELLLRTFSARLLGRLVVFVSRPNCDIDDADWARYVDWLKALQRDSSALKILVTPDGRPPTSAQRSLANREVKTDDVRMAVLLSDPKLVVIVRVFSWLLESAEPFRAHELEKALAYLGESDVAGVRAVIRDLGGAVRSAAR